MGKKAKKERDGYKQNVSRFTSTGYQVEPETAKYFSEIANLLESQGVDVEEQSVICGNALEEARGKELELATDYIISNTLEALLDGCNVDSLCSFLLGCANVFPAFAMDRSGSHVAETALKSLARHVQDTEAYTVIEETLEAICKVIVVNPFDLMCNCYGSHVLRSFLCLCKGIPLDSPEFHGTMGSKVLAKRLNFKVSHLDGSDFQQFQRGFPNLLKLLVFGMVNCTGRDMKSLLVDQYSSLVLQACLCFLLLFNLISFVSVVPVKRKQSTLTKPSITYFSHHDKSSWNWPGGAKMHVMGSLVLQAIFKSQSDWIQLHILSITSMETEHVHEAAKDARGARVIEAFLAQMLPQNKSVD
ncbi:hypothetical protein V6N13_138866 [Hibiscus sabdariffa]